MTDYIIAHYNLQFLSSRSQTETTQPVFKACSHLHYISVSLRNIEVFLWGSLLNVLGSAVNRGLSSFNNIMYSIRISVKDALPNKVWWNSLMC